MSMGQKLKELELKSFKNFSFFEGKITGLIPGISDKSDNRFSIMSKQQFQFWFMTIKKLLGKGAASLLLRVGRETGREMLAHLNTMILSDKEAFNYLLLTLNKLGWGKFWNVVFNADEITLELHHSLEGYEEGASSCYYIKGILEGMGETYMECPVLAIEESCIARKERNCKFKIVKRDKYLEEWKEKSDFDAILTEFDGKAKSKASFIIT
ncbi:MAG: hypothetical protein ACXQS8_02650, partial [Candidatus Helarchaeales archaeon]